MKRDKNNPNYNEIIELVYLELDWEPLSWFPSWEEKEKSVEFKSEIEARKYIEEYNLEVYSVFMDWVMLTEDEF